MYNTDFPKLTKEEELATVLRYQEHKNDKDRQALVLHALRFVMGFIRNKFPKSMHEDLVGEATCGICSALDRFKVIGDCAFHTYAFFSAKRYICLYLDKELKYRAVYSNNTEQSFLQLSEFKNYDEEYQSLYDAIDSLEDKQRAVIYYTYFVGLTKETSGLDGKDYREYATKQKQKALKNLRMML